MCFMDGGGFEQFSNLQAFKGTDIYNRLYRQFHQQIRSELETWAPPGSKIMIAFEGAVKPDGIDWSSFHTSLDLKGHPFHELVFQKLDSRPEVREWPYFLEWLLGHRPWGKGIEPLDLLVRDFFYSDDWSGGRGAGFDHRYRLNITSILRSICKTICF